MGSPCVVMIALWYCGAPLRSPPTLHSLSHTHSALGRSARRPLHLAPPRLRASASASASRLSRVPASTSSSTSPPPPPRLLGLAPSLGRSAAPPSRSPFPTSIIYLHTRALGGCTHQHVNARAEREGAARNSSTHPPAAHLAAEVTARSCPPPPSKSELELDVVGRVAGVAGGHASHASAGGGSTTHTCARAPHTCAGREQRVKSGARRSRVHTGGNPAHLVHGRTSPRRASSCRLPPRSPLQDHRARRC